MGKGPVFGAGMLCQQNDTTTYLVIVEHTLNSAKEVTASRSMGTLPGDLFLFDGDLFLIDYIFLIASPSFLRVLVFCHLSMVSFSMVS